MKNATDGTQNNSDNQEVPKITADEFAGNMPDYNEDGNEFEEVLSGSTFESDTPSQPSELENKTETISEPNPEEQPTSESVAGNGKNWEESAKYFQSQYDKVKFEQAPYNGLIDLVKNDPKFATQVIDLVQNYGQPSNAQPPIQSQVEFKVDPPGPAPEDFDMYEAQTVPTSESAKWLTKSNAYSMSQVLGEQLNGLLSPIVQKVETINNTFQKQQQIDQQRSQILSAKQSLISNGMSPDEATQFVNFMNSSASRDPANWARLLKGQSSKSQSKERATSHMQQSQHASQSSPPQQTHGTQAPTAGPDDFDSSMLKMHGELLF